MSTRSTECYHLDPNARSLRLQLAPGHSLLLPFEQLVFSEFRAGESEDLLTMHFDTHEVILHGRSLRRIEVALQRRELANVVAVPALFRAGGPEGSPLITAIEVVAAASRESCDERSRGTPDLEVLHATDG